LQEEDPVRMKKGFSGKIEVDVLDVKISQKRFAIPYSVISPKGR
jgi:hypothetical protein